MHPDPPPASDGRAGGWSVATTGDGTPTLAHPIHGETCHSRVGAWTEARERYIVGCRVPAGLARIPHGLRGRPLADLGTAAREGSGPAPQSTLPFSVLDVGTGPGMNLAALAACAAAAPGTRPVEVTTLECDPSVLDAARCLVAEPPVPKPTREAVEAARWLAVVVEALDRARAAEGSPVDLTERVRLILVVGDGRETLPERSETYDAVFLDPFSPAVDGSLWEPEFLRSISLRMRPGSWLATYSAASRVRARLAACGLRVGAGAALGTKAEGTLASPDLEPPPLAARRCRRLARRVPALCAELGWPIPPLFGASSGGFPSDLDLESGR